MLTAKRYIAGALMSGCLIAAFWGCSSEDKKDILSRRDMAAVIADLELADAYSRISPSVYNDSTSAIMRQTVLRDHGITQEQYDKNLKWYGYHMEEYTKLYEEVGHQLAMKQEKMMTGVAEAAGRAGDAGNLWPYSRMAYISTSGNTDGVAFSFASPDIKKGERLKWTMHLSNNPGVMVTFGVDYKEGGTSYLINRLTGDKRLETNLQTDSTKTVTRVYGFMRMTSRSMLPVWADSIALNVLPAAPELYHKINSQFTYTEPVKKAANDTVAKADTVLAKPEIEPKKHTGFSAR